MLFPAARLVPTASPSSTEWPQSSLQKCKGHDVHTHLPPETSVLDTVRWATVSYRIKVPRPAPHQLHQLPHLVTFHPTCLGLSCPEYSTLLRKLPLFVDALLLSLKGFCCLAHQANVYSSFQTQVSVTFFMKSFLTSHAPAGFAAFLPCGCGNCALHGLLSYPAESFISLLI